MKINRQLNLEEILTDKALEDELVEVPVKDTVFKVVFLTVLFVVFLGVVQFFNIGLVKNKVYAERALANMSLTVVKPAPRGIIKDRFGTPLLGNKAIINAYLNIDFLSKPTVEREKGFEEIAKILNLSVPALEELVRNYDWDRNQRLLLKSDVSHDELLTLSALNLKGVDLVEGLRREYKNFSSYAHVLGYIGLVSRAEMEENPALTAEDTIGKSGLEAYYDDILRGDNGQEVFLENALGVNLEQIAVKKPTAGKDITISLDGPFQEFLYQRLKQGLAVLGRQSGAAIVINPQNGEILALVSLPSFEADKVAEVLESPAKPLFNRAVSGLYNPGSTIKPLVAAAALKEGVITPQKQIYSAGYLEIPNPYNPDQPSRFLDWKPHGWVDLYSALARSSNVYFYEVGGGLPAQAGLPSQVGLGIERLKNWWQKFGLTEKTNIDLPGENSGFLPDPVWKENSTGQPWRLGDTYNVSIGQGDLVVTPLELLNYISAIANGGKLYQLHLIKSEPKVLRDLSGELSPVLNEVRKGLTDAVNKPYGTAYLLNDLPMKIAAKTGTAQVENNQKINALFIGYLPAEALAEAGAPLDKQIAVLILVEDAREGSLNTLPIARDVFLWYYNNRIWKPPI